MLKSKEIKIAGKELNLLIYVWRDMTSAFSYNKAT